MNFLIQNKLLFPEILWKRPQNIYKRQAGKVLVVAGSRGMGGAAALTAEAAMRAGAGVVVLAFPDILEKIYKKILLEIITIPLPSTKTGSIANDALPEILKASEDCDVVVCGPGLSRNEETAFVVQEMIQKIEKPIILDADGLNALVGKTGLLSKRTYPTILTPHQGEFSRLTGLNIKKIEKKRKELAEQYAKTWKSIIVLKGEDTMIADSDREVINKSGPPRLAVDARQGGPELATAGTGDVLSGIIATFCAQNLNQLFEAVSTAVFLHGIAGAIAKQKIGERSVIASDIIKYLPEAIKQFDEAS